MKLKPSRLIAQLVINATYGIFPTSIEDPLVKTVQVVMDVVAFAMSPIMMFVNPVPLRESLLTLQTLVIDGG